MICRQIEYAGGTYPTPIIFMCRPGDKVVKQLGGLHKFMNWDKPILTDSGGFQVFSLAGHSERSKRKAYHFHSHIDGRKIFMGPEAEYADPVQSGFYDCHGI